MTDIRITAEEIAAALRDTGVSVSVEHSTNSVGCSSYIFVAVSNGRRYCHFGARISDHAVSSSRFEADHGRIQHYAHAGDDMGAFLDRLVAVAARAKAHVGA